MLWLCYKCYSFLIGKSFRSITTTETYLFPFRSECIYSNFCLDKFCNSRSVSEGDPGTWECEIRNEPRPEGPRLNYTFLRYVCRHTRKKKGSAHVGKVRWVVGQSVSKCTGGVKWPSLQIDEINNIYSTGRGFGGCWNYVVFKFIV